MKISKQQLESLPIELRKYFKPIGGGNRVESNFHPT